MRKHRFGRSLRLACAAVALICLALPGESVAARKNKKKNAPEPAAQPQPPATPPTPGPAPVVAAAASQPAPKPGIDAQIERGKAALASGDLRAAIEAFKNALDADKTNPMALHGLGLAQFQSNDKTKGMATLEQAVKASDNANRAVVYNIAVANLRPPENPMRAAKFIKDYLSRPGVPLDEPLQNLLGAALARANDSAARTGTAYAQAREFYFQYDRKLAAARHDGTARWGMRWIPESQAERKWQTSRTRAEAYDKAEYDAVHANLATKKANEAVYDLNHSLALHSEREIKDVHRNLQVAAKSEKDAVRKRDQAKRELDATEMPEFPRVLEFIPIDALKPEQNPPQN
jgi:tetratricopeptide (TPR) repeat protein